MANARGCRRLMTADTPRVEARSDRARLARADRLPLSIDELRIDACWVIHIAAAIISRRDVCIPPNAVDRALWRLKRQRIADLKVALKVDIAGRDARVAFGQADEPSRMAEPDATSWRDFDARTPVARPVLGCAK